MEDVKELIIEIPSIAFGIDVQNYGSDAQLIYMINGEDIDSRLKDEKLCTRNLGKGNFKIDCIHKLDHAKHVHLTKIKV